ncbi:hypothetical protein BU23DRAFT_573805 [Bimuria novae-zelandiae CBS 107.79]|uniref:Uncharacterized protein n=1 Tax=Bimuria novae-zelandiae CBS 107.79 TaxID=1447943 RepID=A0A6A5UP78_9PLEO|nr:hypothetical protein BU23DRAFT_573805 [Bimuria novae-zelandiae CBS 107.79]
MRALAYLSHTLSLRSNTTAPPPPLSKCTPNTGAPGGVYICTSTSPLSCQWIPPSYAQNCIAYDASVMGPPTLLGPDYGGTCRLYGQSDCDEKFRLYVTVDVGEEASERAFSGTVLCPGVEGKDIPGGMRAFRCFVGGMEGHEIKVGGENGTEAQGKGNEG